MFRCTDLPAFSDADLIAFARKGIAIPPNLSRWRRAAGVISEEILEENGIASSRRGSADVMKVWNKQKEK
jgi:hypothetical protein